MHEAHENGARADTAQMDVVGTSSTITSRAYQLEMFEKAKQRNLIVCMDTGSGVSNAECPRS